ncbi:MAG: TIGR00159 family protein [Chloroflexi bacterium]|nr:TIGR00159 family protein [Chloroflexota bacterium]
MELIWALNSLTPSAIADILLVALVFFGISFFIRGTQSIALVRGVILVLAVAALISNAFDFRALRWLLENGLTALLIAIPVIFQPELRQLFQRVGRAGFLFNRAPHETLRARIIEEVCQAAEKLSDRRHGALIVLERSISLNEYIRTGVLMDCEVTPQILLTIFWPKTELHDGAVIIDGTGRIASAASVLPLSSGRKLGTPKLGTRHRAAIGMSEVSDAVCVVVSEETGRISITNGGRMIPRLDPKRLRTILNAFYGPEYTQNRSLIQRARDFTRSLSSRVRAARARKARKWRNEISRCDGW